MSKSELGTGIGVAFSRQVANRLVASQSAMLALTDVSPGQIVIREDDGYYNYFLKALPANSLANWQPMGKDASPIGETVADIITTNENLVAKPDGLYAIAGVPLGGIPSGVALGDIVQKTGGGYTIAYTFSTAPATIYSNSDQKTYNKKTNGAGNPTWETTPIPTTYPCGVGFKYITLQAAIDAYTADFLAGRATVGIIDLWDSIYNEDVTILATVQNLHIRGIGTKYRSNTLVSRITILGHRVTLQNILLTNIAQTPLVINSSGTITESGVPNVGRGKHVLDQVTFSTSQTNAIDVQACDNFLILNNCDFDSKVINIGNRTGTATSITIDGCNNGILNLGNNRFATKNNSLSVYRGTISSTGTLLIDVDAAKPIAYSILRSYSALGAAIPVALGAMIINDDVGGTLQTLKCTTAYTIPVTINTGTPIDLTKYQTGGGGGSLTITYQANSTTFPANPGTGDKMYVTSDGTGNGIIEEIWEYNGTDWKLIEGVYPVSAAVIDNTIADSQLIENPGRYIVPTTGLLNDFVGQANKYADFDGSVFTFTTPANNDTVQINSGPNTGQIWKYTTISGWSQTSSASATTTLKPPLFGNLVANYSNDLNGTKNALSTAITQGVVKIKKNNTVFNLTNAAQGQALGYVANYNGLDIYRLSTYFTNPWPNSNYSAAVIQVPPNTKAVFVSFHNDIIAATNVNFMVNYLDGDREHLGYFVLQNDKVNFVSPYANQVRNSNGYHNWVMIPVHRAGTIELVASQLSQGEMWITRIAFTDNIHNIMVEPALTYQWNVNGHKDPLAAQQFVEGGNNFFWFGAWYETNMIRQNANSAAKAYARVRVVKPSEQRSIVLHYQTWNKNSGMPEVWQLRKKDGTYVTVASGSQASPNFQSQDSLWSNQLRSTLYQASFTEMATHHLIIPYSIWKDCIQVPTMDNPRLDFLNRNANFTITNAQTNANRCFRISTTVANIAVTAQAPTNAGYFFTVYNTGNFAFTFAGVSVPANSFKNFIYNFTTATWGEAQNQVECFLDFAFYNNFSGLKYFFNLATSSDTIF